MKSSTPHFVSVSWLAIGCMGLLTSVTDAQDATRLLRWVPADANAVAFIDVEAVFRSPLAIRDNWKKQTADRFVNQEISIPPDTRRVVMASQLDLGGGLQPVWELELLQFERAPSFALIARTNGGQLDTIAGHSAVKLNTGRTGVELESGVVLSTTQSNRQILSHWVTGAKNTPANRLSPFLAKAFERVDPKSQIVMAIDLAESVSAPSIRELLSTFELLKGKTADQADIADLLSSVKGIVLSVEVNDKRNGVIHVEFDKPTAIIKPIAMPLVHEVLNSLQISMGMLEGWTATTSGTSLEMNGEFSQGDLRKIVSLFAASPGPRDLHDTEATAATSNSIATNPESIKGVVSQKYFHSIKSLIEELRKTLGTTHRDDQTVWMERYARKIDELPIKDVDKDLLTFGGNVSNSFRYQAQAGRMSRLRSGVREVQPVYQSYSYGARMVGPYGSYGGYSFSGTVQTLPDYGRIRTEENFSATAIKLAEMKAIEEGLVQIRRAMTERYNLEF